jgi:ankyrin repeat protein
MRYEKVFEVIETAEVPQPPTKLLNAVKGKFLVDTLASLRPEANTGQPDDSKQTALHWAAIHGWHEAVIGLLELGAEIDFPDNDGRTALSHASEGGHLEVVRVLSNSGARLNQADNAHRTPLSYAASKTHQWVVEFLVRESRAALNNADENGQTPLHWAAKTNSLSLVQALIGASRSKNLFINAADRDGRTALIVALMNRNTEVARLMVDEGAHCETLIDNVPAWQWLVGEGLEILPAGMHVGLLSGDKDLVRNSRGSCLGS